jgi:cell division protein FtsI (penicillin-binding protein 3)
MGTLVIRLAHVQLIEGPALAQAARDLRTTTQELVAERGSITDRHGNAIAESVARYRIYGDQLRLEEWQRTVEEDGEEVVKGGPAYAAELLAEVLDLDREELEEKLTKKSDQERYNQYVVIEKEAAPETWDAVRALRITGIYSENLNKRIYPSGETAKNIIGAVGTVDKAVDPSDTSENAQTVAVDGGVSGLEYRLDDILSGEPGYRTYERSAHGYMLPSSDLVEKPATQGLTVRSTLDMDIQWHAEKALDEQLKKMGANAGSVIVQDVTTCEVLALADRSTTTDGSTEATGRIGAVQDIFEPGSTAKVVTMAAALELGVATPLTRYKVPYMYDTSNGQTFRDSHDHPTQKLTLTGILSESSNTGTVQVGESIPKQQRYDYLYKFGFGQHTGIEIAGETRGILHSADEWDGRTQYGVLFGQGMASNALQATNVFSTVANGGRACQPHLVAGTTDSDGVYTESPKSETKQIISQDVADQVLSMMESVVVEGSGRAGKIDGYRVAGKTGTAQAPGADGKLTSFVSSFIGVAPVDDPRIVVSVIIRDPQTSIWGGVVAAPVFADVMAYSLQQLRVEPSTSEPDLYETTWE